MPSRPPLLSLHRISVRFGAVQALTEVDLAIRAGEIRAVLGENGAGKSTLMNAVYGLVDLDHGGIDWRETRVRISGPADARRLGIGMVHQEFALIDALTVTENLGLSVSASAAGAGDGADGDPAQGWLIDYPAISAAARRRADDLGLEIGDLDARVGGLPVGVRQRIEILKAMLADVRLLILDEPTAVLTPAEIEHLFAVLRGLRDSGVAILLITHKLREVMNLADSVTILRAGRVVAERQISQTSEDELAQLMMGRIVRGAPPRHPQSHAAESDRADAAAAPALLVSSLSTPGPGATGAPAGSSGLDRVDMRVAAGQIYGIAGVDGNGQQQLFDILSGLVAPTGGTIEFGGSTPAEHTPAAFSAAGVSIVPPDRRRDGAVLEMELWENAILDVGLLRQYSRGWAIDRPAAEQLADSLIEKYAIVCDGSNAAAASLSGGNLQKLIVGRALARRPRLLVAFNPTRGLDVGAAGDVYASLGEVTAWGGAVLLISTDLEEIMRLGDRLSVLYRGRLSPPCSPPYDRGRIGLMMGGAASDPPRPAR